jgi:hypothetical protein
MGLTMSLDKINKHGKYRQHVSTRNYFLAEKWGITANGLRLGVVADFGAQNCQYTTKVDARQNVQLTTSPAIEPNACWR